MLSGCIGWLAVRAPSLDDCAFPFREPARLLRLRGHPARALFFTPSPLERGSHPFFAPPFRV